MELAREQGYAVIPEMFGRKEIDQLLREFGHADLLRSRAGVRHAMSIPAVAEMARGAALLGIAREMPPSRPGRDKCRAALHEIL